jgi:hypothetical protein
MFVFRAIMIFLLLVVVVSFMFYVTTGQVKYRAFGLLVVKWAVLAAFGFFGVLLLERIV